MIEVPLTKGRVAVIDDANAEAVLAHKWYYAPCGYAARAKWEKGGRRGVIYMHRFLLGEPSGIVDHINRDQLDNRRSNLRVGNKALNSLNRAPQSNNTSGFRGVDFDKARSRWVARISVDGKVRHLGRFKEKDAAIAARLAAERDYFDAL